MFFAAARRRCADWLPVRIALRGANAATRAHVARVCACDKTRRDEKRRRSRRLLFLLPRPRRELASVLAPTTRRAPLREMAPPPSRRRDQPRASSERRSAATMRRDVPADFSFFIFSLIHFFLFLLRCLKNLGRAQYPDRSAASKTGPSRLPPTERQDRAPSHWAPVTGPCPRPVSRERWGHPTSDRVAQ